MRLLLISLVLLLCFGMISMSRMEKRAPRGRPPTCQQMRRYTQNLKRCLAGARAEHAKCEKEQRKLNGENEKLKLENEKTNEENTNLKTEIENVKQENDETKQENEDLKMEIEILKQEIEETSQCCVRYNGVCHKEGDSFNTIDGCTRCSCSPGGLECLPVEGACVAECEIDGQNYTAGELFHAPEGCNVCTCRDDGSVTCMSKTYCTDCGLTFVGEVCTEDGPEICFYTINPGGYVVAKNQCEYDYIRRCVWPHTGTRLYMIAPCKPKRK